MAGFKHETLGKLEDEERWLKYFPKKEFWMLVAGFGTSVVMLRFFSQNGITIFIEVFISLLTFCRVILGLIPRSRTKYLRGGGVSYYELIRRKIKHKKTIYIRGVKEEP